MLVVEEEDIELRRELQMVDLVAVDLVVSLLQKLEKVELQALVVEEEAFTELIHLIQNLVVMVVQEQL
jgi:hypothetical protein